MVDEDILKKTGADLFRELLRVYSVAELEDYFKAGIWKEDLIKADLNLVYAHRQEAGAPDPPDLEDVPMPQVPKVATPTLVLGMGARPVIPGGLIRPGGIVVPGAPIRPVAGIRVVPPAGTAPGAANGATATSGPAAELKLISLFIAKWKLDPTKAKMLLARMTPAKRRFVITNFKNAAGVADATFALEQYIAQCEKTNAWGAAVAAAGATPATPGVVAPRPPTPKPFSVPPAGFAAAGVKRPMAPTPVVDPSKRPRITPPGQVMPATAKPGFPQMRPMTPGVRPAGAVRPPAFQQQTPRAAIRPVAPAAKAQEKPGNLIRSLLQKL